SDFANCCNKAPNSRREDDLIGWEERGVSFCRTCDLDHKQRLNKLLPKEGRPLMRSRLRLPRWKLCSIRRSVGLQATSKAMILTILTLVIAVGAQVALAWG